MLSGEGMQLRKTVKNNNRSNQKITSHTFFVHFFSVVSHDYNVKLPETSSLHVLWRKCRTCSRSLFLLPLIFTLHWWPLSFLIFLPPLQNFYVVLPTKKMSPLFFISRSKFLSRISSLSLAGLPPTFSFSLCFSCSIFQICGHDNLSKLNTLGNTDTETISAFRFRL